MAHYDVLFDIGYDYGADGGQAWETQIVRFPSGRALRNQRRSRAVGVWQLGNRTVSDAQWEYIQDFMHAMRGRVHSFLFKDWTDYRVVEQQLILGDTDEVQLIKTYGLAINPWVRDILKPVASTVVIEERTGSVWTALQPGVDYELDDSTGIVTLATPPDTGDALRWSGEFYVPARFDRDIATAQFLGIEQRSSGPFHAYAIGDLAVVEELDPEPAEE